MGVISLLWVVVGFSLAFGDSLGGLIGNPLTFFMFDGVGGDDASGPGAHDPADAVRAVPAQVRDHHAGADHRRVRRAGALLELPAVHVPVQPLHLRAARALDLAPAGLPPAVGRARLRGRHGGPHVGGLRRAGRRAGARPAHSAHRATSRTRRPTSRSSCSAPACSGSAGSGSTPARRSRRNGQAVAGLRHHQHRVGRGDAGWMCFDWCADASRRRWARASAPSSAWWPSRRPPASSPSAQSIVIGLVASIVSNLAVHLESRSRRSTTRSTCSPAMASAAWWA